MKKQFIVMLAMVLIVLTAKTNAQQKTYYAAVGNDVQRFMLVPVRIQHAIQRPVELTPAQAAAVLNTGHLRVNEITEWPKELEVLGKDFRIYYENYWYKGGWRIQHRNIVVMPWKRSWALIGATMFIGLFIFFRFRPKLIGSIIWILIIPAIAIAVFIGILEVEMIKAGHAVLKPYDYVGLAFMHYWLLFSTLYLTMALAPVSQIVVGKILARRRHDKEEEFVEAEVLTPHS